MFRVVDERGTRNAFVEEARRFDRAFFIRPMIAAPPASGGTCACVPWVRARAICRVMERLNLTLDIDTSNALKRHAQRKKQPRAALARELIREAISQRETREREQQLARDYAAGRADAAALLSDLEAAQLDLLEEP